LYKKLTKFYFYYLIHNFLMWAEIWSQSNQLRGW